MSRYSRAAARTRAVAGGTSVGGATATTVTIHQDGTIRFNDRFGRTIVVPIKSIPTTNGAFSWVPSTPGANGNQTDTQDPLFLLVDALIART